MLRRGESLLAVVVVLVGLAEAAKFSAHTRAGGSHLNPVPASAPAADGQKTAGIPAEPPPTRDENIGAGEDYTKKLLLLMDTDQNGKVSKKEFMAYMSAEFDRLDVNHDGSLDVKELAAIRVRPYVGK